MSTSAPGFPPKSLPPAPGPDAYGQHRTVSIDDVLEGWRPDLGSERLGTSSAIGSSGPVYGKPRVVAAAATEGEGA